MDSPDLLMVFDFDHSLIDENSDLYIIKLAPNGVLPEEITSLYSDDGWTPYMGQIFKYLHSLGKTPENILECISEIPLTPGMKELLDYTSEIHADHIVISDANSVFIEHILKEKDLLPKILKVFTNRAQFSEDGTLTVKEHHIQDWCKLSTINMCKGQILDDFIAKRKNEGKTYQHVVYVGDGFNDLCPGLRLRPQDCLMAREGFKLNNVIKDMPTKQKPVPRDELKANVVSWTSGLDILNYVKTLKNTTSKASHQKESS